MGVDVMGGGSFNWAGWRFLFDVGVAFGWTPVGTAKPETLCSPSGNPCSGWDDEKDGPWSGTYFSNDAQVVTAEDAASWRMAVEKALACLRGEVPPENNEQAELIEQYVKEAKEEDRAFIETNPDLQKMLEEWNPTPEDLLLRFIKAASGPMTLI